MGTDASDSGSAGSNQYVSLQGDSEYRREERLGCMDLLAATAGMGCALAIRGVILIGALVLLYLFLRLAGLGSATANPHQPSGGSGGGSRILGQALDRWALVLLYFFYFEEQFRGRVVDEFHAGIYRFQQSQPISVSEALDDHLHDGKGHFAEGE